MSIEKAIVAVLVADPRVNGLIEGRIYASVAEQKAEPPFLVYRRVGGRKLQASEGPLEDEHALINIDCFGKDYGSSKALAEAVEAVLDPEDESKRPKTVDCGLSNEADLSDQRTEGSEDFDYILRQTYSCWAG